jgi:hypothetical protein
MNKFYVLLFALLTVMSGCAAVASLLPVIDSAITDTSIVLRGIETVFDAYQTAHPIAPTDRVAYDRLLARAYQTLTLAERAVTDAKQIDQGSYDQAFSDFKSAFLDLTTFLKQKGITPGSSGLVGAGPGSEDFPVPRVIGLRIQS